MIEDNMKTDIELIKQNVTHIKSKVDKIESTLEANYVTRNEFDPVKKIVWLIMSLILTGFISSIVFFLWRSSA